MKKINKNILIATGGTGGHIFPSLSLAKFLSKNYNVQIGHCNNPHGAELLKNTIVDFENIETIFVIEMGCALGVHAGPGSMSNIDFRWICDDFKVKICFKVEIHQTNLQIRGFQRCLLIFENRQVVRERR